MDLSITLSNDQANVLLQRIMRKLGDLTPVMRQVVGIMQDAVEENFAQEGRPRWGSPAHAGIDPGSVSRELLVRRLPRARGDRPFHKRIKVKK